MAKNKIKTRKIRMRDYNEEIDMGMPKHDVAERILYCIPDLTVNDVNKIITKQRNIKAQMSYSSIRLIYYEYPSGSHRPKHTMVGGHVRDYVPNAKENKEYFKDLIKNIRKNISIIHTPMVVKLDSYFEMPYNMSKHEKVLYESGFLHPNSLNDVDNVFKTYTDMMIEQLILNDDLIYKAEIESHFSFLPRIELQIIYEDKFASKYLYNKIRTRKSYQRLKEFINLSELIN